MRNAMPLVIAVEISIMLSLPILCSAIPRRVSVLLANIGSVLRPAVPTLTLKVIDAGMRVEPNDSVSSTVSLGCVL
jgi:hypothetical protein